MLLSIKKYSNVFSFLLFDEYFNLQTSQKKLRDLFTSITREKSYMKQIIFKMMTKFTCGQYFSFQNFKYVNIYFKVYLLFLCKMFLRGKFFSKLCFYFEAEKRCDVKTEALLKMVAPGAGFRGGTLFRTKNRWIPNKKKDLRWDFRSKSMWRPKKYKIKEGSSPKNQWVFGPNENEDDQTKWKK